VLIARARLEWAPLDPLEVMRFMSISF